MSVENNCITPTFKIKRNFADKLFKIEIEKMIKGETDDHIVKLIYKWYIRMKNLNGIWKF